MLCISLGAVLRRQAGWRGRGPRTTWITTKRCPPRSVAGGLLLNSARIPSDLVLCISLGAVLPPLVGGVCLTRGGGGKSCRGLGPVAPAARKFEVFRWKSNRKSSFPMPKAQNFRLRRLHDYGCTITHYNHHHNRRRRRRKFLTRGGVKVLETHDNFYPPPLWVEIL